MKIVFLELDGENVIGWGSQLNNGIMIEIEENHDFFTNYRSYKIIDGQLVKGETPIIPIEKSETEKLKERVTLTEDAIDFIIMNGGF